MVKFVSPRKIAEELAMQDDVSDTLWDLRERVCNAMKKGDYIAKDQACSEAQPRIDAVIRRLIAEV